GRLWLGERLQYPEKGRLQRQRRPEPHDIVGGRRDGYQAHSCSAGRACNSRRPLLWRSGDHGSRKRSQGCGARVYHRLCSGQGRVRGHAYQGSAARRARTADIAAAGRLSVPRQGKFRASFAADVDAEKAAFMADSQVPWGVEALGGKISERAWKAKPSWYLIATDDKMIPPDAQRSMSKRAGSTVVEVKGSHAIYVSQPRAVAALVEQAAKSVKTSAAA